MKMEVIERVNLLVATAVMCNLLQWLDALS